MEKEIPLINILLIILLLIYVLFPYDLLPDVMPVVGWVEDVLLVGLFVLYYLKRKPFRVKEEDGRPDFVTDEVLIKRGTPAEIIVETAKKRNCDLIVMGTHGQGAIADVLIGSTAKWVVRRSPVPVLIIRDP